MEVIQLDEDECLVLAQDFLRKLEMYHFNQENRALLFIFAFLFQRAV